MSVFSQHPYYVYASSEGCGESAHMRICADSSEPSLLGIVTSTCITTWYAGTSVVQSFRQTCI